MLPLSHVEVFPLYFNTVFKCSFTSNKWEIKNSIGLGSFYWLGLQQKLELEIDKQLRTRTKTRSRQTNSLELELELHKQTAWN